MTSTDTLDIVVSAHRVAVGPYGVARGVLRAVASGVLDVPDAVVHEVIGRHAFVVAYADRSLLALLDEDPLTLVEHTPAADRTRFFGHEYVAAVSHGIVDLLSELGSGHGGHVRLVVTDLADADPVDGEFVAIAARRLDPTQWSVVAVEEGQTTGAKSVINAPMTGSPTEEGGAGRGFFVGDLTAGSSTHELAQCSADVLAAAVASDGRHRPAHLAAAYAAASPAERARAHDARAADLEATGDQAALIGPIPYHRERGTDPAGAGVAALLRAQELCAGWGFSAAVADLGLRGRALCPPGPSRERLTLTQRAANAWVPLGDLAGCERLYREMMRESSSPIAHRTALYGLAMLYTRFFTPRDHDRALELLRAARALAAAEPDPRERACIEVYEDNGAALVQVHRGELDEALRLVTTGIERLAELLDDDQRVVHRTQLLHNRARVLVALRRHEEALADLTRLIALDPHYVEYRTDRAGVLHRLGRSAEALADFDHAVDHQPPFPELFYNRADLRADCGDLAGARADYARAVELRPDLLDGWLNLGDLALDDGDLEEAERAAHRGLDQAPNDPGLLCLLAQVLSARGDQPGALALLDRALAADPESAPALATREYVLMLEGGVVDVSGTATAAGATAGAAS